MKYRIYVSMAELKFKLTGSNLLSAFTPYLKYETYFKYTFKL